MKMGVIFYTLTISTLYLTGNTGAYFNDAASVNGVIQAGTWWDKSSLKFENGKRDQCTPIKATVKNNGDGNMQGSVPYEVWWANKGNPKDGVKVFSGEVKALKRGESLTLSYASKKDGNYKFKAYQRDGHPGQGELWSDTIAVNCSDSQKIEETKETDNKAENVEIDNSKVPEIQEKEQEKQEQPSELVVPEVKKQPANEPAKQVSEGEVKGEKVGEKTSTNPQPIEQNETQKDDSK